jgi:hypothetical protein
LLATRTAAEGIAAPGLHHHGRFLTRMLVFPAFGSIGCSIKPSAARFAPRLEAVRVRPNLHLWLNCLVDPAVRRNSATSLCRGVELPNALGALTDGVDRQIVVTGEWSDQPGLKRRADQRFQLRAACRRPARIPLEPS